MKSLIIPIHSFVALITNSSSEVFVCASEDTVKAAKAIINQVTNNRCDELYDVGLGVRGWYGDNEEAVYALDSKEGKQMSENYPTVLVITPKTEDTTYLELVKQIFQLADSMVGEDRMC